MRLEFGGSVKDDLDQMIRDAHRQAKRIKKIHLSKREFRLLEHEVCQSMLCKQSGFLDEVGLKYCGIDVEVHE